MSKKVLAAFLSGLGIAIVPSFIIGAEYGEWFIYPLTLVSLVALFGSYHYDKKAENKE